MICSICASLSLFKRHSVVQHQHTTYLLTQLLTLHQRLLSYAKTGRQVVGVQGNRYVGMRGLVYCIVCIVWRGPIIWPIFGRQRIDISQVGIRDEVNQHTTLLHEGSLRCHPCYYIGLIFDLRADAMSSHVSLIPCNSQRSCYLQSVSLEQLDHCSIPSQYQSFVQWISVIDELQQQEIKYLRV